MENQVLCKKKLTLEELKQFANAVKVDYYFQVSSNGGPLSACSAFLSTYRVHEWPDRKTLCIWQMYYDDLPVWGFIGKVEKVVKTGARKYFLFTHFHFEISYNGDEVIEINVSSDPQVRAVG